MSASDQLLLEYRNKIYAYFRRRAKIDDTEFNPTIRSEKEACLARRLMEETRCHRSFFVVPIEWDASKIDWFTKRTGVDFEITLLQISTPLEEQFFPILWEAYVLWIHKEVNEAAISKLLS